jgi:hypothetical protein
VITNGFSDLGDPSLGAETVLGFQVNALLLAVRPRARLRGGTGPGVVGPNLPRARSRWEERREINPARLRRPCRPQALMWMGIVSIMYATFLRR